MVSCGYCRTQNLSDNLSRSGCIARCPIVFISFSSLPLPLFSISGGFRNRVEGGSQVRRWGWQRRRRGGGGGDTAGAGSGGGGRAGLGRGQPWPWRQCGEGKEVTAGAIGSRRSFWPLPLPWSSCETLSRHGRVVGVAPIGKAMGVVQSLIGNPLRVIGVHSRISHCVQRFVRGCFFLCPKCTTTLLKIYLVLLLNVR